MESNQPEPHCGACDYPLSGLPRLGYCPECGQRYNLTTRLGLRDDRLRDAERSERVLHYVGWGCLTVMGASCIISGAVVAAAAANPSRVIGTSLFVGGGCVALGVLGLVVKHYEWRKKEASRKG